MKRVLILGGCGYIGSALYLHLKNQYQLDTVDLTWFGNAVNPANQKRDYRDLSSAELKNYDSVVLVAAHSSAPMCTHDRIGAFRNNCLNFIELLSKLTGQQLIYASSSCVYNGAGAVPVSEDWGYFRPTDDLTISKLIMDGYAPMSNVEYYGLRFGSVSGYSPNFRGDLMINRMTYCAMKEGKLNVFNGSVFRPILGIRDLTRAVSKILEGGDRRGIYNVASFNARIIDIAKAVAARFGAKVESIEGPPTYDFSIDSTKFQRTFDITLEETVDTIIDGLIQNKDSLRLTDRNVPPNGDYR